MSVTGVEPYLAYGLTGGDTLGKIDTARGAAKSGIEVDANDEITLVAPAKEGGESFRVERRPRTFNLSRPT